LTALTAVATSQAQSLTFSLEPDHPQHLARLLGHLNENLQMIGQRLGIQISNRGNRFHLSGSDTAIEQGRKILQQLYQDAQKNPELTPEMVHLALIESHHVLQQKCTDSATDSTHAKDSQLNLSIRTRCQIIKPRGETQCNYIRAIRLNDINFGIGPAGTGKTYLAVAGAVEALEREEIQRILLVRPAVEAGEKLGFLPGDLAQKVDPYLRPLYDALYEMVGLETVNRLIEKKVIEVAPLAFMRGRTLNRSFVILDESQNTTREQMKMFLTRIGFGTTAVITGDITQVDLPRNTESGLNHAIAVLKQVETIGFTYFSSADVVRHPLVQRIVDAYDTYDQQ
jgi:phosphate starvation-inducible PhoH-like protein